MIHPRFPAATQPPVQRVVRNPDNIPGSPSPTNHWITALLAPGMNPSMLDTQSFTPWKAMRVQAAQSDFQQDAGTFWNRWLQRDSTPYFLPLFDHWDLESTFLEKLVWHLHSQANVYWVGSYSVQTGPSETQLWNTGFESGDTFLRACANRSPVLIRYSLWKDLGGFRTGLSPKLTLWDFWLRAATQGLWGQTIEEYLAWQQEHEELADHPATESILDEHRRFFSKRSFPQIEEKPLRKLQLDLASPAFHRPSNHPTALILVSPQMGLGERIEFIRLLRGFDRLDWKTTIVSGSKDTPDLLADWGKYTNDLFALGNFLPSTAWPVFVRSLLETRRPTLIVTCGSTWHSHLLPWLRSWYPSIPVANWNALPPVDADDPIPSPALVNQSWYQQDITEEWWQKQFPDADAFRLRLPPLILADTEDRKASPADETKKLKRVIFIRAEFVHIQPFLDQLEQHTHKLSPAITWSFASQSAHLLAQLPPHPAIREKLLIRDVESWHDLLGQTEMIWLPQPALDQLPLIQSAKNSDTLFLIPESALTEALQQDKSLLVFSAQWIDDPIQQLKNGVYPFLKCPEARALQVKRKERQPTAESGSNLHEALQKVLYTAGYGGHTTLPPQLGDLWLSLGQRLENLQLDVRDSHHRIERLNTIIDRHEIDLRARLYYSLQDGFREDLTIDRKITPGQFYRLKFSLTNIQGITGLRFDPIDFPGIVTVESILLVRELTMTPLWNSDAFPRFHQLELGGTALLLENLPRWKIFAFGPDPQITIPWKEEWRHFSDLALEVRLSTQTDLVDLLPLLKTPDTAPAAQSVSSSERG
jgi:hypothetical protein